MHRIHLLQLPLDQDLLPAEVMQGQEASVLCSRQLCVGGEEMQVRLKLDNKVPLSIVEYSLHIVEYSRIQSTYYDLQLHVI